MIRVFRRLFAVLTIATAMPLAAASCPLDTTFGVNGIARLPVAGAATSWTQRMFLDTNGRVLLAGNAFAIDGSQFLYVQRVNRRGELDPTFGDGGTATKAFSVPLGSTLQIPGAALDAQGRLLLIADTGSSGRLYRLLANGQWDETVGVDRPAAPSGVPDGWQLVVDNESRVLVVAADGGFAMRFTADLDLDSSFASGGSRGIPLGAHVIPRSLGYDMVVGESTPHNALVVQRWRDDGETDTTFGDAGSVRILLPPGLEVESSVRGAGDELLVSVGSPIVSSLAWGLLHLRADGSLDQSYGDSGLRWFDFDLHPSFEGVDALHATPEGRVALAGRFELQGGQGDVAFAMADASGSVPATCQPSRYQTGLGASPLSQGLGVKLDGERALVLSMGSDGAGRWTTALLALDTGVLFRAGFED